MPIHDFNKQNTVFSSILWLYIGNLGINVSFHFREKFSQNLYQILIRDFFWTN